MVGNTGTYIDCPFHRFGDGDDFTSINIDKFVNLEAIKIVAPHSNGLGVGLDLLADLDVTGKAVLIHTGWDEHWMQDQYYHDHPYLTVEAANFLKDKGAVLVGIDSHNIDDTRTNARPVHTILLGAGILIVEHLCNLSPLPTSDFLFSAAPPKIKGMGTFPVRAYGVVRH
jgi:arylformamidase